MNFKIILTNVWNKIRLYLSLLLFVFYLIIGILFLFTETWGEIIPKGRGIIGLVLVLFGILRFLVAYRRYTNKHKHIKSQSSIKKNKKKEEQKNAKAEIE